jgi:hypothetical protein
MQIFYTFLCQFPPLENKWRAIDVESNAFDGKPLETWGDLRYALEHRMGMHVTLKKGSPVYSCICGMFDSDVKVQQRGRGRWDPTKRIAASATVPEGARIVLKRIPIPAPLKRFVPLRFDAAYQEQAEQSAQALSKKCEWAETAASEEDKLCAMTQSAKTMFTSGVAPVRRPQTRHATDYETGEHGPRPPANYVCRGCALAGDHFRDMCPRGGKATEKTDNRKEKALDRCRTPHGIPRAFLQKVQEGTVSSFRDASTGEFLQRAGLRTLGEKSLIRNTVKPLCVSRMLEGEEEEEEEEGLQQEKTKWNK